MAPNIDGTEMHRFKFNYFLYFYIIIYLVPITFVSAGIIESVDCVMCEVNELRINRCIAAINE